MENAANKEKALGLTVTKLAMLGNEHGIAFTDWVKNVLCPETNIINYDIYKSMKNEVDDLRISRDLVHDSSGVREFFAWAVQIFKVVYENKIVFADEMDRVLNPVLSDRVISFINGKNHFGQFIFTTHNVLHLDLKNYMKGILEVQLLSRKLRVTKKDFKGLFCC